MMEFVVKSIYSLLLKEDFVVLPEFGGFILNHKSAYFDKNENLFYPPSREIGFNAKLKHDDGLLVSYIAENQSVSYAEAKLMVADFVNLIKKSLEENRSFDLAKIGRFEQHTVLQFYPETTNFLLNSYGMEVIYIPKAKPIENPVSELPTIKRPYIKKWLAVASIALSIALIPHDMLQKRFVNTSESNVMESFTWERQKAVFTDSLSLQISNELDALVQKKVALSPFETVSLETPHTEAQSIEKSEAKISEKSINKQDGKEVNLSNPNKLQESFDPAKTINDDLTPAEKGYYLVVGSFKEKQNAKKFFKKIKRKFPDAIMIDYKGFYRVSINLFETRKEAVTMRSSLNSKGVSNWLMRI